MPLSKSSQKLQARLYGSAQKDFNFTSLSCLAKRDTVDFNQRLKVRFWKKNIWQLLFFIS